MPVRRSGGQDGRLYPEPPVAGELPTPAEAGGAAPLADGRDAQKRVRTREAATALAKLPRRSKHLPKAYKCDPRFAPFNRDRLEWLAKRRAEVCNATGGVSYGVGAMLNAAAWAFAAGEFVNAMAAETGDTDLFRQGTNLTTTARGHDRMAWELACLEGVARREQAGRGDSDLARVEREAEEATARRRAAERQKHEAGT